MKCATQISKTSEDFKQIVYPTTETLKALCNLYPSVQYIPFKLHIMRLILTLAVECGFQVSLFSEFLSLFKTQYFTQQKKFKQGKSTTDPEVTIKLPKEALGAQGLWENIFEEVYGLLILQLSQCAGKSWVPEATVLQFRVLNSIRKVSQNPAVRGVLKKYIGFVKVGLRTTVKERAQVTEVRPDADLGAEKKEQLAQSQRVGKDIRSNATTIDPLKKKADLLRAKLQAKQLLSSKKESAALTLTDWITAERQRVETARKELIKMKVLAEKEEDQEDVPEDIDGEEEEDEPEDEEDDGQMVAEE